MELDFRVIQSDIALINTTKQKVYIFDLARVYWNNFEHIKDDKSYTFDSLTQKYLIDSGTGLTEKLIKDGENKEVIRIDLKSFRKITIQDSDQVETFYYHRSVKYFGESDIPHFNPEYRFRTFLLTRKLYNLFDEEFALELYPFPNHGEMLYEKIGKNQIKVYMTQTFYMNVVKIINIEQKLTNEDFQNPSTKDELLHTSVINAKEENNVNIFDLEVY